MVKLCVVYQEGFIWNLARGWVNTDTRSGVDVDFIAASSSNMESALSRIVDADADCYFFLCGDIHLRFLLDTEGKRARLRALNAPLVCYANESIINTPWKENQIITAHALELFRHFFTQDENDLPYYRSRGARATFMPQFADARAFVIQQPWEDRITSAFSFGHTGTFDISDDLYRDRRRIIDDLKGNSEFKFIREIFDTSRSAARLVELYNQFKIVVCLPTNVGGITNRFYEAALCGSTILHYELDNQPLSTEILQPGVNCLTYDRSNSHDLREKIQWLINNPDEARSLAENANQFVLRNHTIEVRLLQIIEYARKISRHEFGA